MKKVKDTAPEKIHTLIGNIRHSNVLVLGPVGSGKSSLINSFTAAMTQNYSAPLTVRNSNQRVTSSLQKLFLSDEKKFKVWDTFGWGCSQFNAAVDLLLEGKLPDDFAISDPIDQYLYRDLILDYD